MSKPSAADALSPRPLEELIRPVRPLSVGDRLADAAERLVDAGGGLPVVGPEGRLAGYLSERDILAAIFPAYLQELHNTEFLTRDFPSLVRHARKAAGRRVEELMSREPVHVDADDSESHAAELFLHRGVSSLPVVDGAGAVVGVVRMIDVVESLLAACGRVGERAPEAGAEPPS